MRGSTNSHRSRRPQTGTTQQPVRNRAMSNQMPTERPRRTPISTCCILQTSAPPSISIYLEGKFNARRGMTDAAVVTPCVAQSIMGIPSDPRFLAVAAKRRLSRPTTAEATGLPQAQGKPHRQHRVADRSLCAQGSGQRGCSTAGRFDAGRYANGTAPDKSKDRRT